MGSTVLKPKVGKISEQNWLKGLQMVQFECPRQSNPSVSPIQLFSVIMKPRPRLMPMMSLCVCSLNIISCTCALLCPTFAKCQMSIGCFMKRIRRDEWESISLFALDTKRFWVRASEDPIKSLMKRWAVRRLPWNVSSRNLGFIS